MHDSIVQRRFVKFARNGSARGTMAAVRVDTHFIATQRQLHAERRRNRFEKEPPPPPPPPKRIAWPGGKISTNKIEALEAFAKRKEREGDEEAARKARESLRKLREATDGSAISSASALSFETKTQRAGAEAVSHE
eukprot:3336968-Pleurochrysis_carterae.AAC.5